MVKSMREGEMLPLSTDQAERARLIISSEEERLIRRAWPFDEKKRKSLITDINTLQQEIIQYFGIDGKTHEYVTTSLAECVRMLREKYNIIDIPLEAGQNSVQGDSGLIIVTHSNGVELIRPDQWRRMKRGSFIEGQVIMLFHGLPQEPANISTLLQRVLRGRSSQLLTIAVVALIAVLISLGPTWLQAYIFNEVVPNGQRYLMIQIAAFLLCIKLTSSGLKLFNQLVGLRLELYLGLNTTALLVDRILSLPASFFERFNIGDLQQRVNSAHALRRVLQQSFVAVITALFVVVLNIALVFFKTYSLELCLILIIATLFGPIVDAVAAIIATYIRLRRLNLAGRLQDSILYPMESIETIRCLGLERDVSIRFSGIRHRIARLDIQLGLISTSLRAITLCLNAGVISVLFYLFSSPETLSWIGADNNGAMPTQGLVVLLLSAFSTINGGVRNLSTSILTLLKVIPDTIRFRPVLRTSIDTGNIGQGGYIEVKNMKLIDTFNRGKGDKSGSAKTVLIGETLAVLHNNPKIAAAILKTIAGQRDSNDREIPDYRIIINDDIIKADMVQSILGSNSILISGSPVFTAGSIKEFITDYDTFPDMERLEQCIDATGIEMASLDMCKRIESGVWGRSNLSKTEALRIHIARALYSVYPIVVLDGVIDQLANKKAILRLREYCKVMNRILAFSTVTEDIAKICDKYYDAREGGYQYK